MDVHDYDPAAKAYASMRRTLRNWLVLTGVLLVGVWWFGLPHLQVSYQLTYRPSSGVPAAHDKASAWYISVTGWKHVYGGQYSREGCPVVVLIPLNECVDLPWPLDG